MAYVKRSEEEKNLQKEITKLKRIQGSSLWTSYLRAICYPHKGLQYTHTYIVTEWYKRLVLREEEDKFFEWVQRYRVHCALLPITRQGARARELASDALFTKEMFYGLAQDNIREYNKYNEKPEYAGYEPEGQESVAETRARLCSMLYEGVALQTMSQFLISLLPVDVFWPTELSPTLEDILCIYNLMCSNPQVCGILSQKEDRVFRVHAQRDERWKNPSYVFTDPLTPHIDTMWRDSFPPDYNEMLGIAIDVKEGAMNQLAEERRNAMEEKTVTQKPSQTDTPEVTEKSES